MKIKLNILTIDIGDIGDQNIFKCYMELMTKVSSRLINVDYMPSIGSEVNLLDFREFFSFSNELCLKLENDPILVVVESILHLDYTQLTLGVYSDIEHIQNVTFLRSPYDY